MIQRLLKGSVLLLVVLVTSQLLAGPFGLFHRKKCAPAPTRCPDDAYQPVPAFYGGDRFECLYVFQNCLVEGGEDLGPIGAWGEDDLQAQAEAEAEARALEECGGQGCMPQNGEVEECIDSLESYYRYGPSRGRHAVEGRCTFKVTCYIDIPCGRTAKVIAYNRNYLKARQRAVCGAWHVARDCGGGCNPRVKTCVVPDPVSH